MELKYLDIHSHLNLPQFKDDREEVIDRMKKAEVGAIVIGVDKRTSVEAVALANKYENIWASVGIHPVDSKDSFELEFFENLIKNPKVVSIGECGLDYYRLDADAHLDVGRLSRDSGLKKKKERQERLFKQQVEFAIKHNLLLMLHVRPSPESNDAHEDVLKILKSYILSHKSGSKLKGNSHFFTSTLGIAEQYFALGFTISFTGLITYNRNFDMVIEKAPLEMIHIETDSPFASSVPHRGERNEPTYVTEVLKKIAEIKRLSNEEIKIQFLKMLEEHLIFSIRRGIRWRKKTSCLWLRSSI